MSLEQDDSKSLRKRLSEIPCLRNSYLYGIISGFGIGLAYFMFTSRPGRSTHVGFSGFVVTTMTYWVYCRHNWSKSEEQTRLFRKMLAGELAAESMKVADPVDVSNNLPTSTPKNL